ncbi:hypothetical protein C8R44DRAFT_988290 [Mycena epipterygia]|nr:hypothetical protein C8R44DRAFT_988290 [Mycena epipterygia]
MALSSQPPELVDIMASFVPLPSDLLSLALTSKALHAIIVPQHLEFREVCCDGRRESLWKSLAENPGPAAGILSLALIYEPVSRYQALHSNERILVPKSLTGSNEAPLVDCTSGNIRTKECDCVDVLCAAIANMHALKRFTFDDSVFGRLHDVKTVFTAVVRSCPNLRELEIDFYDNAPRFDSISDPLEALRLASEMRGQNLKDVSTFLDLENKTWLHLKTFIIEGDLAFTSTSFLVCHPQLEILKLPEILELPTLPNLHWLLIPGFWRDGHALTHFPRLEYVAIAVAGAQMYSDTEYVLRTFRRLPALRGATLSLSESGLKEFSQEFSHFERLSLGRSPWNLDRTRAKADYLPSPECIAILTSFGNLTHLDTSAAIVSDADTDTILDTLLRALAAAPRLQYVGVDMIYTGCFRPMLKWFAIVRDAQGTYVGSTEVRDLRKVRYHDWEDVFRNVGITH